VSLEEITVENNPLAPSVSGDTNPTANVTTNHITVNTVNIQNLVLPGKDYDLSDVLSKLAKSKANDGNGNSTTE
jgi:hypothetical protein